MKVLVTGATGFIGSAVVEQLLERGHAVRAMVRRPDRAPLVTRFDVEAVYGDLESTSSVDRAVDGVDAVIHLGGRATFEPYERLESTIVQGTAHVADAAVRHGVHTVVFGSSAFVYDGGAAIDATTPAHPVLDYGRAKLDAEAVLDDVARTNGIRVANLRLPHVYGPQSLMFGLVRRRIVPFPGAGDNHFAQLHVDDAARALITAAERRWDGTAPIADRRTPTWNQFFTVLGELAPRVRVARVPRWLAVAGATFGGPLLGRIGPTMVSPDTIRGWNLDLQLSTDDVWDAIGAEPELPTIAEGIPATLDGVVAFRWRHPINDFG